ncbi:MAG: DsbA family oxidoreductase [Gammaproteobacteria bacterium]
MAAPIRIQIVSDLVCPWCYVGKRRLEKALAARPDLAASVTWLPYQLSPDMPREGKDRLVHYAGIFGPERARTIMDGMRETAAADGLHFETRPGAKSPNTLAAHVLLYWAGQDPAVDQNALAEKLFAAHHSDSEDLGDPDVLARIAGEVGMDPATVRAGLTAGTDEAAVQGLIEEARQAGVSGVPFFIFNGDYAVSGAQPPEALLEVLDRLAAGAAG